MRAARRAYESAWSQKEPLARLDRLWLLLTIAHAALRGGDADAAMDACLSAHRDYGETGVVVGNPLFHLFTGIAADGVREPRIAQDNFARALICGGPEIFIDEDPRHLAWATSALKPPAGLDTWQGYPGCCRDTLNGASGYLVDLLTRRLGSPPPYG